MNADAFMLFNRSGRTLATGFCPGQGLGGEKNLWE
jgi:hypothetical protein